MFGCASTGGINGPEDSPAAASANLQLGSAYLQQGNLPVAKDKLERAVKQAPRDPIGQPNDSGFGDVAEFE